MKQILVFIFIFLSLAAFGQIPPPTITGNPTVSPTQPVCAGVLVTVTAHATGSSLTYRWFKVSAPRDVLINNSAIYSNATTSALTINTSGGLGAGDYYFVVQNSGGSRTSNQVSVSLLPTPGAPAVSGGTGCSPSKVALSAFNASDGEYRWYNNQGVPFAGERNSNFITPELSFTTVFYVAINNGLCEGPWTQVTATIFTPPNAPPANADPICGSGKVTIYSGGGDNGQFRWYDSNQIIIPGERNATYTTPSISTTTRYYVAISDGQCESAKTPVDAVVNPLPTPPGTPGGFHCGPGVVTMTATGATNGFYQWFLPDGTSLRGQNNSTYTTTSLSTSATYFVSIFDSNCESNRVPIVASINSIPGAPTVTDGSGCGPSKVSLKATGAVDGQYRWYTAAGVLISGETSGTYLTPTITTTTSYIVAISIGGCQGPGNNVTAFINTPPSPPTGFGNSACGPNATVTLSASGGRGTGDYRWYTAAGVLIAGEVNATYTTPLISTTTNYSVAINNGTCESTKTSVTATINTPPAAPTTTGNSACGTSAVTLSASGGTNGQYRWYSAAGVLISGQTNSTYTTPSISVTTSYLVSINNGTCESTKTPVTATINTIPTAPTTTGNSACGTSAVTLSASGGTNGQYRWYSAAGVLISGQTNSTYATPSITVTTSYLVSINNGTCESTKIPVTATINTIPTAPTTTGNSACGSSTLILNASGGTNGQYRWYSAAGVLISGQTNSTYTTPSITVTTSYLVSINNGTCESTKTPVTATINTPPTAPTTTGNAACGTSALALSAAGGTNGQYRWYTAAGVLISGETSSTYTTPTLSTTTSYLVAINNGTCESTKKSVTATINPIPGAPITTGNSACGPSAITLSASGGSAGQYRWYTSASVLISGQTNSTYSTPVLSTTTSYLVSINNGTCESSKTSVIATINTIPIAPTTTGNSACGSSSVRLSAAGGTNGQYRWYTSAGVLISGEINSTYNTPVISTTTNYLVSINNGTCESTKTSVTATIGGMPTAPTITGGSACGPSAITLTANGGGAGQYRWYTATGVLITGETNGSFTTPLLSTTTSYSVSINNGCESPKTPVIATINTVPTAPTTTGNSACGTSTVILTAAGGSAGQYRWYDTSNVLIAGQTNSTYTTPSLSSTKIYSVAINNGTCESAKTPATATILTLPTAPTTTGNSACGPTATITLSASGGNGGQYRWYTGAGGLIAGETSSTYTTPSISTSTNYSVAINNGTCESGRSSVTAQINSIPTAPIASAVSGCAGSAITISATGGSAGQYRWYTTSIDGTAVTGQTNSTYAPLVATTTTFYVSINNGTCESARTPVIVTTNICNQAPVIEPEDTKAAPGGTVAIDLLSLVSDPDNNLDLSTLKVIVQPLSGASATIDGNSKLTLDYKGVTFRGTDRFTVQVCDLLRSCAQKEFSVEVEGDLIIYNGISPNDDGKNDLWIIQGIEVMEDTKANHVSIFNRWGDSIFEADNYDNGSRVFSGKNNSGQEVPAGTYFYKIEYRSGRKSDNGYFTLKR